MHNTGKKIGIILLFITIIFYVYIMKNEKNKTPDSDLKQINKKEEAVEVAQKYAKEKYGNLLTYTHINEYTSGIVNGEIYWCVYFVDTEKNEFEIIVVQDNDEVCVERESYYGHYIKKRMCEWLEIKMKNTSLEEYTIEYDEWNTYDTMWELDNSAEEILGILSSEVEGSVSFHILIPERERGILDKGIIYEEWSDLEKYEDGLNIYIVIFEDEVYELLDTDANLRVKFIEQIKVY